MDESKRVFSLSLSTCWDLDYLANPQLTRDKPSLLQAVPTAKGQALADEYGIKFFETVSVACYYHVIVFFKDLI